MAGIIARVGSGEIDVPGGVDAGLKTLLQIKSADNQRVKVLGLNVSFKGIASNEKPFWVEIVRQTNGGTGGTEVLAQKNNISDSEVVQTTAQKGLFTVEPTTDSPEKKLFSFEVHPQGGWQMIFPFGQEIIIPGGDGAGTSYYLAIRVISDSSNSNTTCVAQIDFEE